MEFKQACGLIPNIEGTARNVVQAGWAEIKDGLPPEMTRFLWFAQTEGDKIVQSKGGQSRTMRVFHKSVSGEETYIVLSEILIDKVRVTGCRLFDFGETRAIKTSEAERFLGRPATKTQAYPEIQISDWEPGLVPEHDSFQIFYVPPGSPAAEMVNFTGIALKADTVGSAE